MKKSILIQALGGANWIGGLYYAKNIAFQLTMNTYINENYKVIIYTTNENESVFSEMKDRVRVVVTKHREGRIGKVLKLSLYLSNNIKYVFPAEKDLRKIGVNCICWIPDFQHNRLPEMFSKAKIEERNRRYSAMTESGMPIILSSEDCIRDLKSNYSVKGHVYCVHFVSYISGNLRMLTPAYEEFVLAKYMLKSGQFLVVMNQFWKHKNHIVALRAFAICVKNGFNLGKKLVLTGNLEDGRNPEYINHVKSIINMPEVRRHIVLLGLIDRQEQLVLMKNAAFVIQPSLFEGWGTVVEDAKVLDKTILLSDIPVHHEQMNEKCILFDPYDPVALADLIYRESQKEHHDDVEKGIDDMYKRAMEYSKGFEQLLRDLEKC